MSRTRRLFTVFALLCGVAWIAKTALIAANGGTNTDQGVVGALWTVGMVSLLAAAATGVATLLRRHRPWLRALAGLVAAPAAFVVAVLVDSAVKTVYPDNGDWLRDEVGLVVVGGVLLLAGLFQLRRAPDRSATA